MHGRKGTSFALFGETVIIGVLIAVLAAPVVTALPAMAAGVGQLRRHLSGESVRLTDTLRDFTSACRAMWTAALGFTGLLLLLVWNLTLAESGILPGATLVLGVSTLLLAGAFVLALRTAAAWSRPPEEGWPARPASDLVRAGAGSGISDPLGSGMLVLALLMTGLFVWMLLPMLLLMGGLLALAVVAVEQRQQSLTERAGAADRGDERLEGHKL